jgi:hypothetical protein
VAMLFSYPSLGCEVLKIGKSVSRVDEPPDEWQPIEGIPIGEQTIQCKRIGRMGCRFGPDWVRLPSLQLLIKSIMFNCARFIYRFSTTAINRS